MESNIALDAITKFKVRFPFDAERIERGDAERRVKDIALGRSADHITASALVVDPKTRALLLIWHENLGKWLQPGGHVESSDCRLVCAAQRELLEETGIEPSFLISPTSCDCPFDIDIHYIEEEYGHGAHFHIDFRFVFFANRNADIRGPEGSRICWIDSEADIDPPPIDLQRVIHKLRSCGIM